LRDRCSVRESLLNDEIQKYDGKEHVIDHVAV
jgi:hypothetical protein